MRTQSWVYKSPLLDIMMHDAKNALKYYGRVIYLDTHHDLMISGKNDDAKQSTASQTQVRVETTALPDAIASWALHVQQSSTAWSAVTAQ